MDLKQIADKRQEKRNTENIYKVVEDPKKPKFYILDMFPYPSGAGLHVGHPKGYIATDVVARKKTLQGFNVLHPMGFDTFGLGTEQYAIDKKMKPQVVAKENIDNFKRQLKMFGLTYDRDRSFSTADPDYYKWTQRIFLQLYNHYYDEKEKKAMPIKNLKGTEEYINNQRLAYIDFKPINRCPKCMTGLANEDLADGKCERCATPVEQKPMKQRVLRITKYAERLLEGLDNLKRDEAMKDLERNRIGKSEGTEFTMNVAVPSKVSKIIILHGVTGHDQRHRFQRLKHKMEEQGVEVLIPNIPNTNNPDYTEQLNFVKKEFKDKLDENTIIIGHSLGCFLGAMLILETGKKIKKLISVGPVFEGMDPPKEFPVVGNYIKGIKINTKKLESLLDEHIIFLSKTDPFIPYDKAKKYYEKNFTKTLLISFEDKGHFSDKFGNLLEFPELLNYVGSDNTYNFGIYTTRIDTVFGMSFVAMAPEYELVDKITTDEFKKKVEAYKETAKHKSQLERTELQKNKSGQFTGAYAINQFNNTKVPVYIADYVLAGYGTGVVMAVPAHDERDFEFANKYKLPITQSIAPYYIDNTETSTPRKDKETRIRTNISVIIKHWKEDKYYVLNRENFGWKSFIIGGVEPGETLQEAVARETKEETGYQNFTVNKQIGFSCFENYYAAHKGINCMSNANFFLVELKDDTFIQPEEEHIKNHKGLRLEAKDIANRVSFPAHQYAREIYTNGEKAFTKKGILTDSGEFTGLESDSAITQMQTRLEAKHIGGKKTNYQMQDRVFSRQRYRGEPFPIARTPDGKAVEMSEKDLPLLLPDVDNYEPTGTTEGPLANIDERVNITLPDRTKAKRETNTMPGRAGSSRYRLRYMDPKNTKQLVNPENEKYRGSVDVYVGGAEHVTRHMIYARFWQKFLYDIGSITHDEPFQEYHCVGLIMAEDGRKMSKRRGNTIDPDKIINEFGHDTFRVYEMFMGPFDQSIARSTNGVKGAKKFLEKIIALQEKLNDATMSDETITLLHQTIKKITEDIDGFKFNTCISQLMILVNHLTDLATIDKKTFEILTILISPFAPHLAEELRSKLGNQFSIFSKAKWPVYDEKCLSSASIKIGVQFNGKVRGDICISQDSTQDEVMTIIKADKKLNARLTSTPKKIIYIPGKILNIVI